MRLDWCQCAWPVLLIHVAGTDSVLTLGSEGEGRGVWVAGILEGKDADSVLKDIITIGWST